MEEMMSRHVRLVVRGISRGRLARVLTRAGPPLFAYHIEGDGLCGAPLVATVVLADSIQFDYVEDWITREVQAVAPNATVSLSSYQELIREVRS